MPRVFVGDGETVKGVPGREQHRQPLGLSDPRSGRPRRRPAMPWHTPRDVAPILERPGHRVVQIASAGVPAVSMQVKPNPSSLRPTGRQTAGQVPPLSPTPVVNPVPPATPARLARPDPADGWIAEGLLKALSLTTALLVEAGVDPDICDSSQGRCRTRWFRLRAIMEGIDPASGFLVVAPRRGRQLDQNP